MAKKKDNPVGMVYSTNPDYMAQFEPEESTATTLPKAQQKLRVKLDTKQRAGKVVTLVEGFVGKDEDLQSLGKELKTKCGAGGSVKEGAIIVQGDYKEKVIGWLKGWGYVGVK
jgi:translation initiation factor 1